MQLQDFYKVNTIETVENKTTANIKINKNHEIFKGHFPNNPVTPGVCMMQIIKELTEKVVSKNLFMQTSSNIKFMAIINPELTPNLDLTLDITKTDEGYKVKNVTKFEDTVALKLSALFTVK
ncbi:3-hydroxyacyl-ACP dehydratase [Lacinutrix sp. 5H-3-7-4]|uniref:3-hydroxyacyl-ACP dehydratase n=1 Tax=Lacinutrix sp. (strain 5H-3-7-4) TaxID=983544 RepID=UPI00020A3D06|nr:3-hydroxyacyl-ACP dehydratase [Lacinutrix sp. 5H-3-7-4]AEH01937.1 Beta-hydroxyacyl-(acyl-carrier-protein) dehydratase FabA/FabZ [Lacinutrix sp. 5H-3-7-4]